MQDVRREGWERGSNNIAPADSLPEGSVRSAVNLDPLTGGKYELRAGYEQVYSGAAVRGMLSFGDKLLIADEADLVLMDLQTNTHDVIRTIAGAGVFTGDMHHGELFFATQNETLRFDGYTVRRWGVPDPAFTLSTGAGALTAGTYKVAVTNVDATGAESGALPKYIVLGPNSALNVTATVTPASVTQRVYVSPPNEPVMYLQQEGFTGTYTVNLVNTSTARLGTELMSQPPLGHIVRSHRGVLLIASGQTAWMTEPLMPHLHTPHTGFYQFGANIDVMESTDGGVFICADRTYFLSGVGTPEASLSVVLNHGAIAGSGTKLPDGRVAWFTRYGQAFGSPNGTVELPNLETYAPLLAEQAASGIVEHNGRQMVVTTMRGRPTGNSLGTCDYFDWEIVKP